MKLKTLSTAILLATVPMTGVFAAAMDRSGQSISAFLQPGNYFEAGISVLDPTVEGQEAGTSATQRNISDMAGDYYFPSAALKFQPTSKFSFGILYDQPFGADAEYKGNNVFVSEASNTILAPTALAEIRQNTINTNVAAVLPGALATNLTPGVNNQVTQRAAALVTAGVAPDQATAESAIRNDTAAMTAITQGVTASITQQVNNTVATTVDAGLANINGLLGTGNTRVEVDTQNLSFIAGFQPTENWNIYAGPVYQTVKGNLSLRGQAYSIFNGYDASIKETSGTGWLAGLAFQIPDIALKASLTYRSEIDHDVNINESIPTLPALTLLPNGAAAAAGIAAASGETKITTPQSVNLDFQTGIMANTVAFANVRWVDWSSFSIRPYKFGLLSDAVGPLVQRPNGFNLVEYSDDQISATVGVGRKLNEQWAGNLSVGWDSGAGNPVSTLGPTEGYWNVGLGLQFSPAPNYFIAGGVKYFWLGDAKAQTGAQAGGNEYVANFEDNNAIAYGLKIGYRF
ncbi:long-chain fatty acid transporter [Acinetobacter sp. SFB]|uniref:outer membrane protein transport protein n=1 Tax=Acinetobacter sp. SFB TaxID=1805634 RepID=UPI0007D7BE2A|nr:outer membrane protein transport protein [Acinetobacter sp. SFB]OAL81235.1 long-chain fatty acid transporter [Acinetobacter sp. SFB]